MVLLDTVHRGDEAYLELITNEHKLIKNETKLANDLKKQEETEREYFNRFSQSLRDSQEVMYPRIYTQRNMLV